MPSLSDAVEWVVKRISALTRTATDADLTDNEYMAVDNASAYTRKITVASLATWILGKIKSLTNIATEADLVSSNYLALDGADGTKKLPANIIPASKIIDRGHASVTTLNNQTFRQNGWRYRLDDAGILTDGTLSVVAGDYVDWDSSTSTWKKANYFVPIDIMGKKNKNQFYAITGGTAIIEQTNTSGGSIYLKYGSFCVRGSTSITYTMSSLATELGVSLVTSPDGVTGCLEIPDTYTLVFSADNKMHLVSRADVVYSDCVILACVAGISVVNNLDDYQALRELIENSYKEKVGRLNKLQIYAPNNATPYIEQPNTANASVYIKFNVSIRGGINVDKTMSQLASDLGVSLVTSPAGITGCLEIPNTYTLVLKENNAFALRARNDVVSTDFVIVACVGGVVVDTEIDSFFALEKVATDNFKDEMKKKNAYQIYPSSGAVPYLEETKSSSIYFKCGAMAVRVGATKNYTMSSLATELGVSLVNSPMGVTGCLEIATTKTLVFSTDGAMHLKTRDNVVSSDVVLIACAGGVMVDCGLYGLESTIVDNVRQLEQVPYKVANLSCAANVIGCGADTESFVFFSDPHCLGTGGAFTNANQVIIDGLFKKIDELATSQTDKVVCGGDLLNENDTRVQAVEKLAYFHGKTKNRKFILALGNHDTNYQGYYDSDAAANTGTLTADEYSAVLFPERGHAYYEDLTSPKVGYFVLDTGSDWDATLTAYRIEQIKWLAETLRTTAKKYAIILMHIFSTGYQSTADWPANITAMATQVKTLLLAVNARSTYTIDGETFDFSNASTKVACILCGHTHYDYVDTTDAIPVVTIRNTLATPDYNIDVGFADFENGSLKLTRYGYGSSRTITIPTT